MSKSKWKPPKGAASYFSPASDEAFKRRHPIGYGALVALGIFALMLPSFILIAFLPRLPNSGFIMLAMAGCFIIGVGLFNLVAIIIGQYLGHLVTIGCFVVGGVLTGMSLLVMCDADIYAIFDSPMTDYYFFSLLFICLPPIFYGLFRMGMGSWMKRKKIRANVRNKLMKGYRNFWWYEEIHAQYGMGILYRMNKCVTILYPLTLLLTLILGWLRVMAPVISTLYAAMSLLLAAMSIFFSVQNNIDEYGQLFVLLRKQKNKGIDSVVFDLFMAAFPLMAGWVHIKMMLDVLQ